MNMPHPDIPLEAEKKSTVTNILDNAVKRRGMSQSCYIEIKSYIFNLIESPGNENITLNQSIALTNEVIRKKLFTSESDSNLPCSQPKRKTGVHSGTASSKTDHRVVTAKPRSSPINGERSRLIKLIELLPPYLEKKEVFRYTQIIKTMPVGPRTEWATPKSTGDVEYQIVLIASKAYRAQFEELLKKHPDAVVDVDPDSGKKIDLSREFRRNLDSAKSLREFLSLKDLIGRHVEHYKNRLPDKKSIKDRLKFWQ